ncbi:MAG: sulfatase-like hydrolase/transferase, partial [Gammaproteobacteria bacterium]|nr:sulfatase-like hydrolase/transferase [Gammaproteobacteria bacterium]
GGGSHFDESGISPRDPVVVYQDQGVQVSLPSNFYSSDYFTSNLIDMLSVDSGQADPFFAFLSFTAPHWPLHAPDDLIEKYAGRYSQGYEKLRRDRIERATELGLFEPDILIAQPIRTLVSWDELTPEQRQVQRRKMAVHAAMVDRLDWNVGRLLEFLEARRLRENTVIIFLSDDGAEGHLLEEYPTYVDWLEENYDNRYENIGRQGSFSSLGAGWAHAANGPLRLFKGYLSEGGTRVSAFINRPGMETAGKISHAYVTAMDFAPTVLEMAGLERPERTHGGIAVQEMDGSSFVGLLADHERRVHPETEPISWELLGRRAVQRGRWKLAWLHEPLGNDEWELFDLKADPGETTDLSVQFPKVRESMIGDWERYAEANGVILPERLLRYPSAGE